MKNSCLTYIIMLIQFLLANNHSCIIDHDRTYRQEYIIPESLQSEHFVIHFTTADNDFQNILSKCVFVH